MAPSYSNGHVSNGKWSVEHNGKTVGTCNAGEALCTYMTLKKLVLILFMVSSALQYYLNLPFYFFPVILSISFVLVFLVIWDFTIFYIVLEMEDHVPGGLMNMSSFWIKVWKINSSENLSQFAIYMSYMLIRKLTFVEIF